jgi:hypothetical protein
MSYHVGREIGKRINVLLYSKDTWMGNTFQVFTQKVATGYQNRCYIAAEASECELRKMDRALANAS